MRKTLVLVTVLIIGLIGGGALYALTDTATHPLTVNINEVAALGLNDAATTVALTTIAPVNEGDPVTGSTDATKRLFYTCLNAGVTTRTITVGSSANITSAGVHVEVTAVTALGAGTAAGAPITLSTVAGTLVSAIPSVATGRVAGNSGTGVTYALIIDTPASLDTTDSDSVVVTFTLTEDL